jgi:hypothetical protein
MILDLSSPRAITPRSRPASHVGRLGAVTHVCVDLNTSNPIISVVPVDLAEDLPEGYQWTGRWQSVRWVLAPSWV